MAKIGDNIKKYRELKSITREQMAAELNMTVGGYSKIERNETDLTLSKIQKIAQILQVDLSQIMNFDARQVFNISGNNKIVQGSVKTDNVNIHGDDYKEKYIKLIVEENERLKEENERLKEEIKRLKGGK